MPKLRYFALKDDLGFPIPSTMRGYKKDPCKCELVEITPIVIDDFLPFRHYHPNGLHYFFQVSGNCCDIVPNSLISSRTRPKGANYREFYNIPPLIVQSKVANFTKNDCPDGEDPVGVVPFFKIYVDTTQEKVDAKILADTANFNTEGQAHANDIGTCAPTP